MGSKNSQLKNLLRTCLKINLKLKVRCNFNIFLADCNLKKEHFSAFVIFDAIFRSLDFVEIASKTLSLYSNIICEV